MAVSQILTHPGGAHKDDFLACCVMAAKYGAPIVRREPTPQDLAAPDVMVIDVGLSHDPDSGNFDHHQFPRDHEPICALSLVLQYLGHYEDARQLCDWLEPAEYFDTRGAIETAKWLGVSRETLFKLNSPIDVTLLRRFAQCNELFAGDPLYEIMRWVGEDLLHYLVSYRERIELIRNVSEIWEIKRDGEGISVLFVPRCEPLPEDPSAGLERYLQEVGRTDVAALVYPDRRGPGYGLSRHQDDPRLDFTLIENEPDVHFAHNRGFVAKSSATEKPRLRELVTLAWMGACEPVEKL